jgi:hypothetical protein
MQESDKTGERKGAEKGKEKIVKKIKGRKRRTYGYIKRWKRIIEIMRATCLAHFIFI